MGSIVRPIPSLSDLDRTLAVGIQKVMVAVVVDRSFLQATRSLEPETLEGVQLGRGKEAVDWGC